ncbi:coniferyl alcohol acyltransferase-like [Cornus florida]|uniref:coniferyl alcohol acyltransferase-like n=1 Tax=Cornus florida TaxID=4283 RepID=UPI002899E491|nr:coniferyl alcohol acyltransferase-like [Cornus florida]
MDAAKGDFCVRITVKEVVAALLPMQEHWLQLSNLDLLLPPLDVGVFFCYKKPTSTEEKLLSTSFTYMVSVLKKAMAQALVPYYAWAGEVVQNPAGEPELLCNNRGVDFLEAFADVELRDLNLYNPDESVEGKLVPEKKHGVLSVQATQLKCGGLVVGCKFDHRVADAYSANMFLVSWAEKARSKPISRLPSFRRSLLSPRHPGCYHPSLDDMYVAVSALPPPRENNSSSNFSGDELISRIYYVEAEQLSRLQSLANNNGCRNKDKDRSMRTKLEAFTAFLWKLVAASEQASNKKCRMGIVVDGRTRLSEGYGEKSEMMATYFGNVLSIPFGEKRAGELMKRPVSWVADAIHEFLDSAVTKEHFLGLIDWVEAHRPEPNLAMIYAGSKSNDDGPAIVVSSGQKFPVSKVDFGWGKPAFGSYHFPWGGESGYVMPMPSPNGNGDWVVYMHMFKGQLQLIESQAPHFFKPLTSDYYLEHF